MYSNLILPQRMSLCTQCSNPEKSIQENKPHPHEPVNGHHVPNEIKQLALQMLKQRMFTKCSNNNFTMIISIHCTVGMNWWETQPQVFVTEQSDLENFLSGVYRQRTYTATLKIHLTGKRNFTAITANTDKESQVLGLTYLYTVKRWIDNPRNFTFTS